MSHLAAKFVRKTDDRVAHPVRTPELLAATRCRCLWLQLLHNIVQPGLHSPYTPSRTSCLRMRRIGTPYQHTPLEKSSNQRSTEDLHRQFVLQRSTIEPLLAPQPPQAPRRDVLSYEKHHCRHTDIARLASRAVGYLDCDTLLSYSL